jgi:hypothetical protein
MGRLFATEPQESKGEVRLECQEIGGGNRRVNHAVELPGLVGWIYSDPVEQTARGGEVHYISVCSKRSRSIAPRLDPQAH